MNAKIKSVAIIGGGPAASCLGVLLARKGIQTAIYYLPKRVPLIVGESTVPAVIPILRLLGVEDEVRSYSMYKPGATVNMNEKENFYFQFANLRGPLPVYAYNVPRDKFDETLLNAARKAGVKVIEAAANLEKIPGTDKVKLDDATLAAAGGYFSGQPDLIVDATGRLRLLPKLLGIKGIEGGRTDRALFAHVDQAKLDHEGHVHSTRMDHGWSWRIPLPGRVSVGLVIGAEHLPKFGATKEEQYDNLLKQDSVMCKVTGNSKRLTPVMEHSNYQLVSERMFGGNWALVGDTAGFIDPVFSSGLLLGFLGALELSKAIEKNTVKAFKFYQDDCTHHLKSWHEIVGYFYDGKLFHSASVGERMQKQYPLIRVMMPYFQKNFGRIFTGLASNSNFSLGMLRWIVNYSAKKESWERMRIK